MERHCVKALVTGKVQGVWYRRATQEKALQAGVTGHARNLPDGRVEVLMCGRAEAVRELGEWLWTGPPDARVTHVELEGVEAHEPDTFTTG
ncbi:acylphosphatase [Halomonas eurihalina]|uniref:acylphosphatase n=1 Tax=Halomonas eurihalina TaxID=42566 RepID=A0A5D9DA92_HALER|nr:acylphosphatase [Halomonas eurihalina]MDR5858661.1 acylphosphatase [Halomonas eurihalina]TZG40844.1 acylphosphatase [Halomonas eurihalina]